MENAQKGKLPNREASMVECLNL